MPRRAPAIETVYPNIADSEGLPPMSRAAGATGFTGMMAIHPARVAARSTPAFRPSEADIAHARAVIEAFAANPGAGC